MVYPVTDVIPTPILGQNLGTGVSLIDQFRMLRFALQTWCLLCFWFHDPARVQEDEIAVNVLTGGDSPYLALVLPRLWRPLIRSFLTFGTAAGIAEGLGTSVVGEGAVAQEEGRERAHTAGAESRATEGPKPGRRPQAVRQAVPQAILASAGVSEELHQEAALLETVTAGMDHRVAAAFRRWLVAFTWFMKKVGVIGGEGMFVETG